MAPSSSPTSASSCKHQALHNAQYTGDLSDIRDTFGLGWERVCAALPRVPARRSVRVRELTIGWVLQCR
jgi:hypothetical protein